MKKFLSVIVSILSIFATSCQSEENEVRQSEDSFTKNSTVATLVKRVAQAPTKIDDVVDGSDDFSVKLPVTITLNNQEIKITSTDDYGYVQFVKNKSNLDNDLVSFHFPIVVTKPNFEEQTINNQRVNFFDFYNSYRQANNIWNNTICNICFGFNFLHSDCEKTISRMQLQKTFTKRTIQGVTFILRLVFLWLNCRSWDVAS